MGAGCAGPKETGLFSKVVASFAAVRMVVIYTYFPGDFVIFMTWFSMKTSTCSYGIMKMTVGTTRFVSTIVFLAVIMVIPMTISFVNGVDPWSAILVNLRVAVFNPCRSLNLQSHQRPIPMALNRLTLWLTGTVLC